MTSLAAATVFLFLAADCPLSKRYAPELQQLAAHFQNKNIVFFSVYPNANSKDSQLARKHGATVTPQAVVTAHDGT
ncbi:MAG: hypothetical protein JJE04_21545, partial [Acidobacteriia bacterium]|nr:hypothetical protein [Terriglobia bacterium]